MFYRAGMNYIILNIGPVKYDPLKTPAHKRHNPRL